MNKLSLIFVMSFVSAGAHAQGTGGVTMSTDPAKAAAVEQHAQELQARQSKEAVTSKPPAAHSGTTHKAKGKTSTPHKSSTHKSSTHKPGTAPKS